MEYSNDLQAEKKLSRVLSICSSAEEGFDGVGDFALKLSGEFASKGFLVELAAIYDKHVAMSEERFSRTFNCDQVKVSINVIRRKKLGWFSLWKSLEKITAGYSNYDLAVLHWVPHGWDKRGIAFIESFILGVKLRRLRPVLIVHEFAQEIEVKNGIRHFLYALIQEYFVSTALAKIISPRVVVTSTERYCDRLRSHGINPIVLPVFSNIERNTEGPPKNFVKSRKEKNNLVVFGRLRNSRLLRESMRLISASVDNIQIALVGNGSDETKLLIEKILDELDLKAGGAVKIVSSGYLEENSVSDIFNKSDIALTGESFHLWGKSGVIAAYRYHRLPVLFVSETKLPHTACEDTQWAFACNDSDVKRLASYSPSDNNPWSVSSYAESLLDAFQSAGR